MNETLRRINEAINNNNYTLDLSFLGLNYLPIEIEKLTQLRELNLSNNSFTRLPTIINSFEYLESLNLSNNCFSYISGIGFDIINNLSITEINLSGNNLVQVPDDLFYLKDLEYVELNGNPLLDGIPKMILEQGYIAIYNFVNELRLSNTADSLLEAKLIFVGRGEVGKTSLMKKLIEPNIKITEGYEPTTHGINIRKWPLDIYFSKEELLRIFDEEQDEDNGTYESEPNLDTDLEHTISDPIYDPDEEYYYHSKNLENEVSIIYNNDDEDEYSNVLFDDYINKEDINEEEVREFKSIKTAKLNVWDFGGQEIYYSTHQFFLTKRSIYVFVWDARKEEEYRDFEYWFNTINILSERSPLLVVMNKVDSRTRQIDESILKKSFPNILDFCKTSSITGEGMNTFRNSIRTAFKTLPHIGDKLPIAWLYIREDLNKTKENFITYERYIDTCRLYDINKSRANFLSGYLHDLGDVLHFQNDEVLRRLVILNPDWVTNAFYRLIDSRIIQENNGKFVFSQLQNIWDNEIHPVEKHLELIRLIENFELCFNIAGSKEYIIPELVPARSDYKLVYLSKKNETKFEYRFKFMPSGILTRFICRNFLFIEKRTFWKNGLVIRYEDSLGLIIGDPLEKKIKISVSGEDRSALLGIIRKEFNFIFESMKIETDNDYFEMIPCNCELCIKSQLPYYYKFSVLRKFARKGKITIECQNSADSVNIANMMKGYNRIKQGERVLEDIIIACSQLQGNHKILNDKKEDTRNTMIATILSNRGYSAKDQSRWGSSATNISQGEIDIKLETYDGSILGIFEAMNLESADTKKIHQHLEKLFNYDPNASESNFIVVYSDSSNFINLWYKYQNIAESANYKYQLIVCTFSDISDNFMCGRNIRIGKTDFKVNDKKNSVYHIFVNMHI